MITRAIGDGGSQKTQSRWNGPFRIAGIFGLVFFGLAGFGGSAAHAQWGWGGWGGWALAYGGNGAGFGGMTLADQQFAWQQNNMMMESKFQLQNAQAMKAYQSALLLQQQAISTAMDNQERVSSLQEKFNIETRERKIAREEFKQQLNEADFFTTEGKVKWPAHATPTRGTLSNRLAAANQAIEPLFATYRKTNAVKVRDVVTARRRLQAYGEPALSHLRGRGETAFANTLLDFLNALDLLIIRMSEGEGQTAPPAPATPNPN